MGCQCALIQNFLHKGLIRPSFSYWNHIVWQKPGGDQAPHRDRELIFIIQNDIGRNGGAFLQSLYELTGTDRHEDGWSTDSGRQTLPPSYSGMTQCFQV